MSDSPDQIAVHGVATSKYGAGRIARPFAWASGLMAIVVTFLTAAMPPKTVTFVEPYLDYKWVVVEQATKVGTGEAFRGPLITAGVLFFFVWLTSFWLSHRRNRIADVVVDDAGVALTYRKRWPKQEQLGFEAIAAAQAPTANQLVIHLRRGGRYEIATGRARELAERIEQGRAAAPALPAGRGWNALPLGSAMAWAWAIGGWWFVLQAAERTGTAVAAGLHTQVLAIVALSALWLGIGFTLSSRTEVLVGSDGVTVDHPWRKRFVPYHLIDDVQTRFGVLRLVRKDGKHIAISTQNTERLERDLRAALARYHNPEARGADHHQNELARGDRSHEAWREDLAKVFDKQDYRGARLRVADLVELVGDGHADPEQRVAAALALPKDDETLAQIRVAAAHCADIDTKAAIEAAAAGEVATAELTRATRRFRDAEL